MIIQFYPFSLAFSFKMDASYNPIFFSSPVTEPALSLETIFLEANPFLLSWPFFFIFCLGNYSLSSFLTYSWASSCWFLASISLALLGSIKKNIFFNESIDS